MADDVNGIDGMRLVASRPHGMLSANLSARSCRQGEERESAGKTVSERHLYMCVYLCS